MGDLSVDTAVDRRDEREFGGTLSPEWEIWGPNGGYLAAVAMRAAGIASDRARPASINAHFVGAGQSGEVTITTEVNRATRVATSVSVRVAQDDRLLLSAIVWGVDGDLDGLEHHTREVPSPTADPELQPSLAALTEGDPRHPFWSNLDIRPLGWIHDWDNREPSEPSVASWVRFVPRTTFEDPWVDSARSLILIDLDSWPSATRAHVGDLEHYAPTIELSARFIGSTAGEPWLLSRAATPRASRGLMASTGEVWTSQMQLAAIGGSTLLCRPATRRPDR
jgi:acyl-CoA thioesterase II